MKTTLYFRSDNFASMIRFVRNSERKMPYQTKATRKMGLWLVKDEGIYIMAPGGYDDDTPDNPRHVVYADTFHPEKDSDVWDRSYRVSRDDFAEWLELSSEFVDMLESGSDSIRVRLSPTHVEVSVSIPKKAA